MLMKSFLWFVIGVASAVVGTFALSRSPQGKAVLDNLSAGADVFIDAMTDEYDSRRSDKQG
jgi:hypothetical protein